jgi:hypothetical protein
MWLTRPVQSMMHPEAWHVLRPPPLRPPPPRFAYKSSVRSFICAAVVWCGSCSSWQVIATGRSHLSSCVLTGTLASPLPSWQCMPPFYVSVLGALCSSPQDTATCHAVSHLALQAAPPPPPSARALNLNVSVVGIGHCAAADSTQPPVRLYPDWDSKLHLARYMHLVHNAVRCG